MKKAMVTRLGAFGDMVMASPLFRLLKEDGYYTVANVNPRGKMILENNPYVNEYLIHIDDSIPREKLDEHWKKISEGFDRFINLSGSIEDGLLKMPYSPIFHAPQLSRHLECNVNYYDRTLEIGGYGHIKGVKGELYFTQDEERWAKKIRDQHKDRFVMLWSLSGSSPHKVYPYAEQVANEFLKAHKDAVVFTVGDPLCVFLEFLDAEKIKSLEKGKPANQEYELNFLKKVASHDQVKRRSGVWNIRHSFIMTKYADVIIGSETGVLNAAGCYPTPKIVLLSHSSHENLSKYWENCYPVEVSGAEAPCHPCHKMIYSLDQCMNNSILQHSMCMAHLRPEKLLNAMEDVYKKWRVKKDGAFCSERAA